MLWANEWRSLKSVRVQFFGIIEMFIELFPPLFCSKKISIWNQADMKRSVLFAPVIFFVKVLLCHLANCENYIIIHELTRGVCSREMRENSAKLLIIHIKWANLGVSVKRTQSSEIGGWRWWNNWWDCRWRWHWNWRSSPTLNILLVQQLLLNLHHLLKLLKLLLLLEERLCQIILKKISCHSSLWDWRTWICRCRTWIRVWGCQINHYSVFIKIIQQWDAEVWWKIQCPLKIR